MKLWVLCLLLLILAGSVPGSEGGKQMNFLNLMPVPEKVILQEGMYRVTDQFTVGIDIDSAKDTGRINRALQRMMNRLAGRTSLFLVSPEPVVDKPGQALSMHVSYKRTGELRVNEDESYTLDITSNGIQLNANTDIGILRGIETLLQLLNADKQGYYFPGVSITDSPRFTWRGMLIDPCRHFLPVEVIKRNLDGMAAVKMNVLHLHITEDQGFRIECKTFPKLHLMGSDGMYYTHEQIKEIIAYAADRGIRVMPEFDIPGHSTAWLVGYPELASAPGPYSIERGYGVKDPTFDPTNKATYKFFDKFFKEMSALFPDEYIHIGGDENSGNQWNGNAKIQEFKTKHKIKSNDELQAYFNNKILGILTKYKKKMMGWDEIYQPGIPQTVVIHSWRGKDAMRDSAKKGYNTLLSNGYYIDLCQPAEYHYLNDPIPADSDLTTEERSRIFGGEATMWAELVSFETVDSRIWPRTAAIAERLWSPASITDVRDMYRRMAIIGVQLEEHGLLHLKNRDMFLRRLTKGGNITALNVLVDVIEPLKGYNRHSQAVYTFYSPLTRIVDAAAPESLIARDFRFMVSDFLSTLKNSNVTAMAENLKQQLITWKENHAKLLPVIDENPALKEIETLSEDLSKLSVIGLEALDNLLSGKKGDASWLEQSRKTLEEAKKPRGHGELVIITGIEQLVKGCEEI